MVFLFYDNASTHGQTANFFSKHMRRKGQSRKVRLKKNAHYQTLF